MHQSYFWEKHFLHTVNTVPGMECATTPMQQNSKLRFQTCVGAQETAQLFGFCEDDTPDTPGAGSTEAGERKGDVAMMSKKN